MKIVNIILMGIILSMGIVLHLVVPGVFFGMKFDMMLAMMFLGIMLFPEKKHVLVLGLATGALSALTTSFPGGQIPNMIDKPITAFVFFGLYLAFGHLRDTVIGRGVITALGTMISGAIFLTVALSFVGLPGSATFTTLFLSVVLPTTISNTILLSLLYPVTQTLKNRSRIAVA